MATDNRGRERAKRFGNELKLARVRARVLQTELAEALGVHSTSVSQWERGDRARVPDPDTVQEMDDKLGANGALMRAAGYAAEQDGDVVTIPTTGPMGPFVPLPPNLTSADVATILEVARRLSEAHGDGAQATNG